MGESWMPTIDLSMSVEEFHRLPRNPAYRYEYVGGTAYLSPRPRHYHALLALKRLPVDKEVEVRPLGSEEVMELVPLFAQVFQHVQPYGSLDEATRMEAARQALTRTRTGGDGPWIEQASFVACVHDKPQGAILITLLPRTDPCSWDGYRWLQPPPPNSIERRLGRPHLTWVFVAPRLEGRGIGTALLAASVNALLGLGYHELLSTFMIGNDSSLLWHWRNGFQLLPYPGSKRQLSKLNKGG
jgi:GNAT superfamily N-acetyltransferase